MIRQKLLSVSVQISVFDAALHGVEPDQRDGHDHIEDERYVEGSEYEQLQHGANHEETHGRTEHLRHEEHPGAGAVGVRAEPLLEVAVDRQQIALVEHRHEHEGDGEVADDKAENHLEVGVALGDDHAGDRDECDARDGRADHGESHDGPRRLAVAVEESRVVGAARGEV